MASTRSPYTGQWLNNPVDILQAIQDSQQQWIVQHATYHDIAKVLKQNCKEVGLEFHGQTPRDGNCFFHAVSDQLDLLGQPAQSAADLRQTVVTFLRRNPAVQGPDGVIDFTKLYPDWTGYCDKMQQDGEWADHVILVATAHVLRRDIMVVTSSPQSQGDQMVCWIRSAASFSGNSLMAQTRLMVGHLWEWHYQSLQAASTGPESKSKNNFIRLHLAVQYTCQEAIPCISEILKTWHDKEVQKLQPCQFPKKCASRGKPKRGKSCPACVDWGNAVDAVYYKPYKNIQAASWAPTWANINPTRLHHDPIEAAKAFVLRLVPGKTYFSLGDFDAARLLMIMMNFAEFHRSKPFAYEQIKKVFAIRNDLSHVNVNDQLGIEDKQIEESFQALQDLIQTLIILHPKNFRDDVCGKMQQYKSYPITEFLPEGDQKLKVQATTEDIQEDNTFDVVTCQRELRHFYLQTLCKIPQFPGVNHSSLPMDDYYTDVSIFINLPKPCTPIPVSLKSHHEIFTAKNASDIPPSRILVLGHPGCGKSMLTLKLAHDWAAKYPASPLKNVDLLFALNMRWMKPETTLEDAIFRQLLPDDTDLSKTALRNYVKQNQSACVVLFDSFDEYGFSGDFNNQASGVHGIILNRHLREYKILVTSRFWKAHCLDDLQSVYSQMQINGFSDEHVKEYVFKFFKDDKASGDKLLSYLTDHNLNPGIANVPLMTLLFCLYWKEYGGQSMPDKIGDLYSEIFALLQKQFLTKNINTEYFDLQSLIIDAGKVALTGLWSSEDPAEDQLVFSSEDFIAISSEETLTAGCKIGLLSTEQQRKGIISTIRTDNSKSTSANSSTKNTKSVTFFHKSCQEKCAGEHLATLYQTNPSDFTVRMQYIDSSNTCMRLEMVLRFACGASAEVACQILHRLIEIFRSEFAPHLSDYCDQSLEPDFTKDFQKFIELCLQCYYECPDVAENLPEQLHIILNELFLQGQILFIGMSPYTSSAVGKYMLHAQSIKTVTIKAIPSPSDGGTLPIGAIGKSYGLIQNALKRLSKERLQLLYQQEMKYSKRSPFQNLCRTQVTDYFKKWQSSHGINLVPVFNSLQHCHGFESLILINVQLGSQMTTLQRAIDQGSLMTLTILALYNSGLTDEQVDNLLESIPDNLPRLDYLDICYNKARLIRLGDCLVKSKIQDLQVFNMRAPADDMCDVIRKLPQFGSRMKSLYMHRNEIDNYAGKLLADAIPSAGQLQGFSISMDWMKRDTHNQVVKAMHHLVHLTRLRIYDCKYLGDLLRCLSNTMESMPDLHDLMMTGQAGVQQTRQSPLARLLPRSYARDHHSTGNLEQHVGRSACQRFISRLDTMARMKKLSLQTICLHKEDMITLLTLCRRRNYTWFRYSRHLFPDDIDARQYDFLEFS